MKVLVTGAAGFIGSHVALRLLEAGVDVVGIDNLNSYYDVTLKEARLARITDEKFSFQKMSLEDRCAIENLFVENQFDRVIHLAAQAGVRYSLTDPLAYVDSNVTGFTNILEGCRHSNVGHLVYASTSSVYGANTKMPFSVHDNVDHPVSFYAATKKANELMAHTYAHLFRLPCTGLRFFTVYGPWGRPDMALFKFTDAILRGEAIEVYNDGKMKRDFTFVDDIVSGIVAVSDSIPTPSPSWSGDAPDPSCSNAPYRLFNIGNNKPVDLMYFIDVLEDTLGKKAERILLPLQPGDVPETYADIDDLVSCTGVKPDVSIEDGIAQFVKWYRGYYNC